MNIIGLLSLAMMIAAPAITAGDRSMDLSPDEPTNSISFSTRQGEIPVELVRWHDLYRTQFGAVESSWARLLRRLAGHLPGLFERQCTDLNASLDGIDPTTLLPVPDRLIDFYLKRLLLHLDAAGEACTRDEIFNVVYRLEEARSALAEVRWLLDQRGIGR